MNYFGSFREWLDKNYSDIDAIFFDIDGTLISGRTVLVGAKEIIHKFNTNNFPYLLLTNDGNHSVKEKSQMTSSAGLSISPSHFISCSMALKTYADKNSLHGAKFFVMGDLGKPCFAEQALLRVERNPKLIRDCYGVIVGEGIYDWQSAFFAVLNFFLKKPEAPLLVPNPDSYWPNGSKGDIGIGAGAKARFICMLLKEYGLRKNPVYFGKPYKLIYDFAFKKLSELYPEHGRFNKKKLIMLGDSLRSDIRGGRKFGIKTGLLLSGITKKDQLKKIPPSLTPDFVFEHL